MVHGDLGLDLLVVDGVQTTLLGFAITIILALVAALVGPLFVDWGSYRAEFEARASRLTGLDVRVTGAIDARLLPIPALMLQNIEFGRGDERVRARALRIEFALAALARGEWRVTDARLEGPEFAAGLDGDGRLLWPAPKIGFDPEGVSIERLNIQDGRAVFTDGASGARLVLDKLEFKGELRSLAGPVKGQGSFVVGEQHYPYRINATRIADDGVKVRLAVDPIDRPLTAEADVSIWIERGMPRFEGGVQLARAVGRPPAGAPALIVEPWRVTSRLRGDGKAAVLEQIELQYGPDERAIKLKGSANVTFGQQPEVNGVLSSSQIDLDRLLALPEATRQRPLTAAKTLAEALLGAPRLPIATSLSIGIEAVTLGGATLQRVGADLTADADGFDIRAVEFRAPGLTQVRLSGRLLSAPTGARFDGPARVEASDPRALIAWLTDSDARSVGSSLRLGGDVSFGSDALTIERLKIELDRMTVAGRVAYAWPNDGRPARLDAALTAPDLDLDRVHALARAVLGDAAFERPREGALSLKIARAMVTGVEAKQVDVNMRIDANGLEVEQLAVGDFGGAALAVKGRIDTKAQSPRGAMTIDLDARALDGVTTLIEKFAPRAADQLRQSAARLTPVALRAVLGVEPGAAGGTTAKFKVDGRAGTFRVALQGDAGAASDAFRIDNLAALAAAKVNLSSRLDAGDGEALIDIVGLDRLVVPDKRPGRLTLTAKGPLDGELTLGGQLAAGALNIVTDGTLRLPGRAAGLSAGVTLKVTNANIRSPRPVAAGRPPELLPLSMTARLAVAEGMLRFTDATGTVAGTSVSGRLAVGLQQQPITVDGDIALGTIDLPAALAALIGVPAPGAGVAVTGSSSAGAGTLWPAEPFEPNRHRLSGQIAVKSERVAVTPKLAARDLRCVLQFSDSELAVQTVDGSIAGGRVAGDLMFARSADGLSARGRLRLAGANIAELLPGEGALSGRLTLDVAAEGTGMSAVALVGSLGGSGTFTLENARLARLDPAAFGAVARAVDQGLPIDVIRVRDRTDTALARDGLAIPLAEGAITISAGQARLSNLMVRAQDADLAVSGSADLAAAALDARLTLTGASGQASTRPEVAIALKGPIDAPKRTIDVAALASWLALRAVEQQSRKLDALEGREPAPSPPTPEGQAAPPAAVPAARAVTPAVPPAEPDGARQRPAPAVPAATSSVAKPKPATPSAEQLQPLPPPIDIRPAPVPHAPRTQPGAISPPAPKSATAPPPAPPRPRSLSEILFGN